jgi:DNA-binding PadR family transcriptional regulator
MSLSHILLGMLQQPASGYDLKQQFQERLSHYWGAELAQIYPTLKRMQKSGLLTSTQQASTQGPPKRMYQRTDAGRAALQSWLLAGPEVHMDRLSWLAQVAFLDTISRSEQQQFFVDLRQAFIQHRLTLLEIEAHWREDDPAVPDHLQGEDLFAHMTLRLGVEKYATIVDWCTACLQRIEKSDDKTVSDHTAAP